MANRRNLAVEDRSGRPQTDDTDVAVADRPAHDTDWNEVEQANILINPEPDSMEWRG